MSSSRTPSPRCANRRGGTCAPWPKRLRDRPPTLELLGCSGGAQHTRGRNSTGSRQLGAKTSRGAVANDATTRSLEFRRFRGQLISLARKRGELLSPSVSWFPKFRTVHFTGKGYDFSARGSWGRVNYTCPFQSPRQCSQADGRTIQAGDCLYGCTSVNWRGIRWPCSMACSL